MQLITLSEIGGAQKVVFDIIKGLDPDIFEIHLACRPGGTLIDNIKAECPWVQVHPMPFMEREIRPLQDLRALLDIINLCNTYRFDIVHCHSTKAGVLGRLAAKLTGVSTCIFTVHGWGFYSAQNCWLKGIYIALEKLLARWTTCLVFVSKQDQEAGIAAGIAASSRGLIIHNGVETGLYSEAYFHHSLPTRGLPQRIITIGRLAEQKAPFTWLEIARQVLRQAHGPVELIWVGDGPLNEQLQQRIALLGLSEHIKLLGNRADIPQLLAESNLFLLTSKWEGLPLVVLEAMAAGLPVVSFDVGGVSECIEDGKSGFLLPPGEIQELTNKVITLLNNRHLAMQLGAAGKTLVQQQFDIAQVKTAYMKLYLKYAGKGEQ